MQLVSRRKSIRKLTTSGLIAFVVAFLFIGFIGFGETVFGATENGSIGLEGKISAPPPKTPATISFPGNGATINSSTVTVTGVCPTGTLVKIFKNNVFAGSVQCVNGSYSIEIDLFSGVNEIVARVYDDLDQAGPDSNKVTVTVPSAVVGTGPRISLTSNYAKRGANPGEKLIWPIVLTGGNGPYAISIDWGDGTDPTIISREIGGSFNIEHTYDTPGIYNIIVRATDKDGNVAFLQLVGVGNGPLSQTSTGADGGDGSSAGVDPNAPKQVRILWQPAAISIPLILSTFYLGRRYELKMLRRRLEARDEVR